jgi:hypothetical protein
MKRTPESFELSAEDIKEAIAFWMRQRHTEDGESPDFDVQLVSSGFTVYAKAIRL